MFHEIITSEYARRLIRSKSRLLATYTEFSDRSVEDLSQDLLQHLISGILLFDPEVRHANVFVRTIIERAVSRMLRRQTASKRGNGRVVSGEPRDDRDGTSFDPADYRAPERYSDLALDLADALSKLPLHLQQFAQRLLERSIPELADEMNVAPSTLWRWKRKLLQHCEDEGLRIYLPRDESV